MRKEQDPNAVQINQKDLRLTVAFVDEKAEVITVCHQCGILYTASNNNSVTRAVTINTAQDHGDFFSSGHHVSVVSGESPASLEETYVVNKCPQAKPYSKKHFLIPM